MTKYYNTLITTSHLKKYVKHDYSNMIWFLQEKGTTTIENNGDCPELIEKNEKELRQNVIRRLCKRKVTHRDTNISSSLY